MNNHIVLEDLEMRYIVYYDLNGQAVGFFERISSRGNLVSFSEWIARPGGVISTGYDLSHERSFLMDFEPEEIEIMDEENPHTLPIGRIFGADVQTIETLAEERGVLVEHRYISHN